MEQFLMSVAKWSVNHESINPLNTWWVFPNRRSGVFFMHYYKKLMSEKTSAMPQWLPQTKTINEFIGEFSRIAVAEPIELLAILYKIYLKKTGSLEPFDHFYMWGEMMLNDFNDIDKYRVSPDLVFSNLKALKEMDDKLSYLTNEQLQIVKRFFSSLESWEPSEVKQRFLEIWEVLLPVYQEFRETLVTHKIGYEGLAYDLALKNIEKTNDADLPFTNLFFVGFNAITPTEEHLFTVFRNRKFAQFFWDYDQFYIENEHMEAGLFLRKHLKNFPEPVDFTIQRDVLKNKTIQAISVPTDSGQIHKAARLVSKIPSDAVSDTALVLSDENLLMPTLQQIPENVEDINVTMGFPFTESLTGSFINSLIQLQLNAKHSAAHGFRFYYKNVLALLRHPFIQQAAPIFAEEMVSRVLKENLIQIPAKEIQVTPLFYSIFAPTHDKTAFLNLLKDILSQLKKDVWNSNANQELLLEQEFALKAYLTALQLSEQINNQQVTLTLPTYFKLLQKVLNQLKVPFEGEPINGLQVMGFLETRNLDFKNVIILSVNEGQLPTSGHAPSFIPYSLRRGFGLPTRELHDAMYAYYFYRLLQRAENVWLLYNVGLNGINSEDKSRFIYQMLYNKYFNVTLENDSQLISVSKSEPISVPKDAQVLAALKQFTLIESEKKLSPSALSGYIICPLRFYYRTIAGIHEPDEVEEQIDARLFGNIFHLVSEKFYTQFFNQNELVTTEKLASLQKNDKALDVWIKEAFKEVLIGKNSSKEYSIEGKNLIVFEVIRKYLHQLITIDLNHTPFSIVGLEHKISTLLPVKIQGKDMDVILGGTIDRLDRTDKGLRIIDYKTGTDKLGFNDLEQLFDSGKTKDVKAVFQTFVYSLMVAKNSPGERYILPTIYQVKDFYRDDLSFNVYSDKFVPFQNSNFIEIKNEFTERLEQLIAEIFDARIPFTQTEHVKNCEFCTYKNLCNR
ncbi:MAG TPA: hypothetical protein DCQ26_07570 [Marinilabiliales bacterium]|nr:hypothetical protein [Marinilabiliales bacterium]HBX83228.1 hypothetical protein [Marinilabiliales bacterium]HBY53939.1 hypothetical protein [Marinilabiliales bacterium]HCC29620.1 hypothetical protein [Marinilabiliales bacterium]